MKYYIFNNYLFKDKPCVVTLIKKHIGYLAVSKDKTREWDLDDNLKPSILYSSTVRCLPAYKIINMFYSISEKDNEIN